MLHVSSCTFVLLLQPLCVPEFSSEWILSKSMFAIPPDHLQGPGARIPTIAVETAGETVGKLEVLGGCAGELLRRLPLLCCSRQGKSPQQFPRHRPPALRVSPAVSPTVSTATLGNRAPRPCRWSGEWQICVNVRSAGRKLALEICFNLRVSASEVASNYTKDGL